MLKANVVQGVFAFDTTYRFNEVKSYIFEQINIFQDFIMKFKTVFGCHIFCLFANNF